MFKNYGFLFSADMKFIFSSGISSVLTTMEKDCFPVVKKKKCASSLLLSALTGIQSDFKLSLLITESGMSQILLISYRNNISVPFFSLLSSQYSNIDFLLLGFKGYAFCMSQAAFGFGVLGSKASHHVFSSCIL